MKPAGAVVTLTVARWDGEPAVEGDFLRTRTGRCYRIDRVEGRRLVCTVLEKDAVREGEPGVWEWAWSPRRRRGSR